jgi:flagellar motor switch protein FliN/FliY
VTQHDDSLPPPPADPKKTIGGIFSDIPVEISVELGRIKMPLREVLAKLSPGSVVPLSKLTGERLDVRVNDRLVARGEAVAIGERYAVRIVELVGAREEKS